MEALNEGLCKELIDVKLIVDKTMAYTQNGNLYSDSTFIGIKSSELDNLLAETAAYLNILHPDYGKLAARIAVTKLHKETKESFLDVVSALFHYTEANGNLNKLNPLGENASLISQDVYEIVVNHHVILQGALDFKRDLEYDYFGYKTLERAYLLKISGKIVERP